MSKKEALAQPQLVLRLLLLLLRKLMNTASRNLRIADIDLWEGGRTFANLTDASNILEFRFPLC